MFLQLVLELFLGRLCKLSLKERYFWKEFGAKQVCLIKVGPNRDLGLCGLFGFRLFGINPFFDGLKGLRLRYFEGYPLFDFEFPSQMLRKW